MTDPIVKLELIIIQNLLDVNNLKNEVEKKEFEKNDQLKEICLRIIEILDSFEQIEESLTEKININNEDAKKIINRYTTIRKKLLSLLKKYGVTKIEFPNNRLIVGLCEVVEIEADNIRKNDEIISIVRNGYIRGKELIRASQIVIVKN